MSPHMPGSILLSFRSRASQANLRSLRIPNRRQVYAACVYLAACAELGIHNRFLRDSEVCVDRKGSWIPSSGLKTARHNNGRSIPFRILKLLEPVEADLLDDPAVDHDDARLVRGVGVDVLVDAIGRNIDEIALLPVVALGLRLPLEFHGVVDVELHVPMQVIALAIDHVDHFLGEM